MSSKDDKKVSGTMGILLAMDQEFKDKQAPKADLSGVDFSGLDTVETEAPNPKPESKVKPEPKPKSKSRTITKSKPLTDKITARDLSEIDEFTKFKIRMIPAGHIQPWAFANRPDSEFGEWDEFVKSISRSGVEVPIIVRYLAPDSYEVVAGRRRWKACLELGLHVPCDVRKLNDADAARLQQLENDKRSDLSAWADAMYWASLLEKNIFSSQSALAIALERDRRVVSDYMAYTRIPDALVKEIGHLSNVGIKMANHLARLCKEPSNIPKLIEVAGLIREGKISVTKVNAACSSDKDETASHTIKVNGIKSFTLRSDSNGTPTISFRKEILEHLSIDDCLAELVKFAEKKVK